MIDPDTLFRILDISAVVANGLLGGVVARSMRFDFIGFFLLATVTGVGGGMIRDVLLDSGLPIMLTDQGYVVGVLVASLLAYTIDLSGKWANRALVAVDFLGMGCWTATGVTKALLVGVNWLPAIAMGVITSIGGGMIRDIMVNQVPGIFGGRPLYATVAIIGATNAVFFNVVLHQPELGMGVSVGLCFAIGVTARWRRWVLPGATSLALPRVPRPRFDTFLTSRARGWIPGDPVITHNRSSRRRRRWPWERPEQHQRGSSAADTEAPPI